MATISATELARQTSEVLDQVLRSGQSVSIERNRKPIAQLIPVPERLTVRELLAKLSPTLSGTKAQAWLVDSRAGFDESVADPFA